MRLGKIFFCYLLIVSLIGVAQAANYTLTSEVGETYIQWGWKTVSPTTIVPPIDIYLDDNTTPAISNYTGHTFLQTNINPDERHNIAIYNSTERVSNSSLVLLVKGTVTTLKPAHIVYILLIICISLTILCFLFGEVTRLIMISVLNIILSISGIMMSSCRGFIPYLFIGLAIITGIILIVNGFPKLKEEINWW